MSAPKYPWQEWLDGEIHVLWQRLDFDCDVETFREMAHRRAGDEGRRVATRSLGPVVLLKAETT